MSGRGLAIAFLILLVVVLLNLPLPAALRVKASSRENLAPFENLLSLVVRQARDAGRAVTAAAGAADQRRALEARVADLRVALWRAEALARENETLRRQLDFTLRERYRLVPCEVVARGDAGSWWQVVTLNRGRAHGLRPNLAVVTLDGLIGRTTNALQTTCDVMLLSDPSLRVACKIRDTDAFGILRGGGLPLRGDPALVMLAPAEPRRLDYLPRNYRIPEGSEVVTSGLGGVYPEGLPVGRALRAKAVPSGLYQSVEVEPAADLRKLEYVFVVVGERPDWTPPAPAEPQAAEAGDPDET